jgi:cytochrome c5
MPDGAGKAIVQKQCAVCHAVTVVTAKHASRSEWEQVVNQMVSRGADLSDDDIDTVLEYLTKNYGPLDQMTTPPADANAPHQ